MAVAESRITRELIAGDELHITMPDGRHVVVTCEQRTQDKAPSRARFCVQAERDIHIKQVFGANR